MTSGSFNASTVMSLVAICSEKTKPSMVFNKCEPRPPLCIDLSTANLVNLTAGKNEISGLNGNPKSPASEVVNFIASAERLKYAQGQGWVSSLYTRVVRVRPWLSNSTASFRRKSSRSPLPQLNAFAVATNSDLTRRKAIVSKLTLRGYPLIGLLYAVFAHWAYCFNSSLRFSLRLVFITLSTNLLLSAAGSTGESFSANAMASLQWVVGNV